MADEPKIVTREELHQENARRAAREAGEAHRELPIDEAPEGGRYMVGGELVDAEGKPVKGK